MAENDFSLAAKVINGGVAGVVGVTATFPIDLVKTRLQKQRIGPNGTGMYNGMWDCFKKTWHEGSGTHRSQLSRFAAGTKGLYQGYGVNVTFITAEKAIKLAVNDVLRHYLRKSDGSLSLLRQVLAGGGAGLCQIVVTTPMEFLKIQLQDAGRAAAKATNNNGGQLNINGSVTMQPNSKPTITKMLMDRGVLNFIQTIYKGFFATMCRDVPFSMVYFPLFAALNQTGPRRGPDFREAVWYWSLGSGIVAGATSALVVNPVDVIKTRIQILNPVAGERVYNGIQDAVSSVWREEGWQAFFKGAKARMIVIAPLFGIAQAVYFLGVGESVLRKLNN